jgi:hypothetical protein
MASSTPASSPPRNRSARACSTSRYPSHRTSRTRNRTICGTYAPRCKHRTSLRSPRPSRPGSRFRPDMSAPPRLGRIPTTRLGRLHPVSRCRLRTGPVGPNRTPRRAGMCRSRSRSRSHRAPGRTGHQAVRRWQGNKRPYRSDWGLGRHRSVAPGKSRTATHRGTHRGFPRIRLPPAHSSTARTTTRRSRRRRDRQNAHRRRWRCIRPGLPARQREATIRWYHGGRSSVF